MGFTEFGLTDKESSSSREALNKHSMGRKKYMSMIDKGVKADSQKNLPFDFSKPQKEASKVVTCWCPSCGAGSKVTKATYMIICRECKEAYFVTEDNSKR